MSKVKVSSAVLDPFLAMHTVGSKDLSGQLTWAERRRDLTLGLRFIMTGPLGKMFRLPSLRIWLGETLSPGLNSNSSAFQFLSRIYCVLSKIRHEIVRGLSFYYSCYQIAFENAFYVLSRSLST